MQFPASAVCEVQFFVSDTNNPVLANATWFPLPDQRIPGLPSNCKACHATGDADLVFVMKVVESASAVKIVLIVDDTDLLFLLI